MFGMQDDDLAVRIRHEIGVEAMTWGTDFPHVAANWPDSLNLVERMVGGVPDEDARKPRRQPGQPSQTGDHAGAGLTSWACTSRTGRLVPLPLSTL